MLRILGVSFIAIAIMISSCTVIDDMKEMSANSQEISKEMSKTLGSECLIGWNITNGALTYQVYVKSPPDSMTVGNLTSSVRNILTKNTEKEITGISIIIGDPPPSDDLF